MFVNQSLLGRITALERQVQALRNIRGLNPIKVNPAGGDGQLIITLEGDDWFPVQVTGYHAYDITWSHILQNGTYNWIEQTYDQYGNLIPKDNGRTGGYSGGQIVNPLYEMNFRDPTGITPSPFPFYAFARRRIISRTEDNTDSLGIAFEFDWPEADVTCSTMEKIATGSLDKTVVQLFGHDASGNCTWYTVGTCNTTFPSITIGSTPVIGGSAGDVLIISGGDVGSLSPAALDAQMATAAGAISDGWH